MNSMSDWYSRSDELVQTLLGLEGVGLCGIGSDRCHDVAGADRKTELLSVLASTHPDYNAGLAKLTKELNRVFAGQAERLLRDFVKREGLTGDIHLAVAASQDRLYLTFAQRLPPTELARRGARLAEAKLREVFDNLTGGPRPKKTRS